MNVTGELNLALAILFDRVRQLTHLADVSCLLMDSKARRASDYERSVRVSLQNSGIGLYQLKHPLFSVEAAHKKDGLALANFLAGKEQLAVDPIEYDFGLGSQGWRFRRKAITEKTAACHHPVDTQRQVVQHL